MHFRANQNGGSGGNILFNGGNVGIGTTSPNFTAANRTTLDINGVTSAGLGLSAGGTLYGYVYANSGVAIFAANGNYNLELQTNSTTKLAITGGGNVGIGTTSPGYKLDVVGDIFINGSYSLKSSTNGHIFLKNITSDANSWIYQEAATDWGMFALNNNTQLNALGGIFTSSGLATFMTSTTGTGVNLSSATGGGSAYGSIAFVHDTGNAYFAGNVGIGTSTPGYKLDVNGNVRLGSNIYTPTDALNLYSGTNILVLTAGGGSTTLQTPGGWTGNLNLQAVNAASSVLINTNGSNRITVLPSGNVGIGTTSPLSLFTVNGGTVNLTTYTSSETRIADGSIHLMKTAAAGVFEAVRAINSDTTAGTTVRLVAAATSDPFNNTNGGKVFIDAIRSATNMDLAFLLNDTSGAAPVERVRFLGSGNVGIGTASPSVKLDVVGEIRSTSTSGYAALVASSGLGFSILADTHTSGAMTIWTAGSEKMRVNSAGNVGINTTDPKANFHVNGGAATLRVGPWFSSDDRDFIELP